ARISASSPGGSSITVAAAGSLTRGRLSGARAKLKLGCELPVLARTAVTMCRGRGIWRVDGAGRMMGRPPAAADAAGTLVEALAALLPAGSDLALAWADVAGTIKQAAAGSPGGALLPRAGRRA